MEKEVNQRKLAPQTSNGRGRAHRRAAAIAAVSAVGACAVAQPAVAQGSLLRGPALRGPQLRAAQAGGGTRVDGILWPKFTGKANLTMWTFGGEPGTKDTVEEFEKVYPSVKVDVEDIGGGPAEYAKLATTIRAGSGAPDVALVEYDALAPFVADKGLANLSPYVGKYMSLIPGWVTKEVTFNGGVYDFPAGGGTMALFYNSGLLAKYHLPVPTTYAVFSQDAQKLHADDPQKYLTFYPTNDGSYSEALWMQAGANPFSVNSSGDWTVSLTQPLIEKVTSYWVNLVREGLIPQYQDYTAPWEHAITAGTFASFLGASWEPGYGIAPYVKSGSQSFLVRDMPQWSSTGTPIDANWGGSGYVVTRQSSAPEAGALLAAFMDLGSVNVALKLGGPPPLINNVLNAYPAFKLSGKVNDFPQANLNVIFDDLQKYVSPNFTFSPWTTELSSDLEVQLADAFVGKESAAQALANTQSEIISFGQAQGYSVSAG